MLDLRLSSLGRHIAAHIRPNVLFATLLIAVPALGWSQSVKSLTLSPSTVTGGSGMTGTVTLSSPAVNALTVNLGSDQACVQVPATVTVAQGSPTATFSIKTTPVASTAFATVAAGADGTTAVAMATVDEPKPASLTIAPSSVIGGSLLSATVQLSGPAPTGGLTIYFANNDPSVQPPAGITIPAGSNLEGFTLNTTPVSSNVTSTVWAYTDVGYASSAATVKAPTIKSIALTPTSVLGGGSMSGTVTLTGPAPSNGVEVSLSSSSSAVHLPSTVGINTGSSIPFTATTVPVASNTVVTIKATGLGSASTTVTILAPTITVKLETPQVFGGQSVAAYVYSSAPAPSAGLTVALSSDSAIASTPASVVIPSGVQYGYFSVTTVPYKSGTAHILGKLNGSTSSATLTVTATGLAASPWPKFHSGSLNDGLSSGKGAVGNLKWKFTAPNAFVASPVIGADGTIYAGDFTSVFAWNPTTGEQKWKFSTNDSFNATGAVGANGLLYIGGLNGNVYALNASTGALKWTFTALDQIKSAPAIGPDGTVYVGAGNADQNLYALNGATGKLVWKYKTGGGIYGSPAITSTGLLYFGSNDGNVYSLYASSGNLFWKYTTGGAVVSSPAIDSGGNVYVGSEDDYFYAFNAQGNLQWRYQTGGIVDSSPAIGPTGTIYVGSYDDSLYAFNSSGALLWSFAAQAQIVGSPAIAADGTVYIGSWDTNLYAVNGSTGKMNWLFGTQNFIYTTPAIGADGTVYFGSTDDVMYAIK